MEIFSFKERSSLPIIVTSVILLCISSSQSAPASSTGEPANAGQIIKNSMNTSINPCEDFYQYVCGNWPKYNPSEEGYSAWTSAQMIMQSIGPKISSILNAPQSPADSEAIRKAKEVFRVCENAEKAEEDRVGPIKSMIEELGGWPLLMTDAEWEAKNLTWQQVHARVYKKFFTGSLFQIENEIDLKNSSYSKLTLGQGTIYLRNEDLLEPGHDKVLAGYINFIRQVAYALQGSKENSDLIKSGITDLINFEKTMAQTITPNIRPDTINEWYHLTTVGEFQEWYDSAKGTSPRSNIDWLATCRDIFSIAPEVTIDASEPLLVMGKEYFPKLAYLLATTPPKIIANYIVWRGITSVAEKSPGLIRDSVGYFTNNEREGVDPIGETNCATESQMGRAVSYAFVKEHFSPEAKEKARQMLNDILEAMKQHIQETTWMDDETKNLASEKIAAITTYTGYPDDLSAENIENEYKDFVVSDRFLENELMKRKLDTIKTLKILGKPVDKKEWSSEATTVNAFYQPTTNAIVVPAGILQPPFYDANRPDIINYAMMGTMLGHEVSHAMDAMGRRYDKNGNLIEWWKQESIDKYNNQTKCFVDQFNKFTIFNDGKTVVKINGEKTLEENMSDTTGLKLGWKAAKVADAPKVAGLEEFTNEQIFFLAYGNLWCLSAADSYFKNEASLDEHSPGNIRIVGSTANFDEFSKAFNCPAGTPLNPTNKCNI